MTSVEELLSPLYTPFCGLLPHFVDGIFTVDDVDHPEPAPDLFVFAARRMGVMPTQVVLVEETHMGIAAAKAAGMQASALPP